MRRKRGYNMERVKILLVDDELLLIDSLEIILSLHPNYLVVGKAKDGIEALQMIKKTIPDLALVDLNMAKMGGLDLIRRIKARYPHIKILVLTTFYDQENIATALSNGANGYLLKDSGREAILSAIENILHGQSVLDQKVLDTLTKLVTVPMVETIEETIKPLSTLTKREQEICAMLAEGYTNHQIASFLFISEGTVKNYISSIYDKYDLHDRAALVVTLRKQ